MTTLTVAGPRAAARPLAGRVAVVTGSGRNIGRAIVLALARAGADVVVHARASRDEVDAVAREAAEAGVRAVPLLADVRDPRAVERMVEEARRVLGPVDVLVNSAAVRPEADLIDITLEEWRDVLSVVLDGAFLCAKAVIPDMVRSGRGRIVNVAGLTGQSGAARRAHVVTAKAGLIGLTKALALEYAGRGITVNAVSPGMIETARGRGSVATPAHHADRPVPVGRRGRPEEVAALCCYLASDDAAFITGQVIGINGGAYL